MYCKRVRGLSWEEFSAQGDFFRKPSAEAQILADLFAQSEDLRSFDKEDMESEAGKKRVFDFITGYLADYAQQAKVAGDPAQGLDMFGNAPTTLAEILQAQRDKPGPDGGKRFSIAAVRRSVDEALARDENGHYTNSGGKGIRFADNLPILEFLGIRANGIFTTAKRARKMETKHFLTAEQISRLAEFCEDPVAVFEEVDDMGGIVILTDELAPCEGRTDVADNPKKSSCH